MGFFLRKWVLNQAWWYKPGNPSSLRFGLYIKSQANQKYIVRPCHKFKKEKNQNTEFYRRIWKITPEKRELRVCFPDGGLR